MQSHAFDLLQRLAAKIQRKVAGVHADPADCRRLTEGPGTQPVWRFQAKLLNAELDGSWRRVFLQIQGNVHGPGLFRAGVCRGRLSLPFQVFVARLQLNRLNAGGSGAQQLNMVRLPGK